MSLNKTNLIIESAPIPATWSGTPDNLREEIVKRLQILSPGGTNFVYIGDTEPTSNLGPWLKGGTKWYVFDEVTKRYIPVDISDSSDAEFQIGDSIPSTSTPGVWLRTTNNGTIPVTWYFWNGAQWVPGMNIVQSGPTATRPTTPTNLQQFYDSDISCLIWWERGAWRTLDGVPGDVKIVATELLSQALTQNPGWQVLGFDQQSWRGRYISQATKDTEQTLTIDAVDGIAQRSSHETFGETDGISMDGHTHGGTVAAQPASSVPYPPTIALWYLVKT